MQCKDLIQKFKGLPSEYGFIPFWFWNDDLQDDHLLYQLNEMHDKGMDQFLIHARFGLQVKYLSEEWFAKVGFILEEARKLNMAVWIYDEENWPSGCAGERVTAENPDYCGKALFRISAGQKVTREDWRFVLSQDGFDYYRGYCHWEIPYTNSYYIDMLSTGATDRFIEVTHAEYVRRFGNYLGSTLKGFFVDEPGFYNNCHLYTARDDDNTVVWCDDFPAEFTARKGYDLLPVINRLWQNDDPDAVKIKADFYDVAGALYRERFLGRIRDYCHSNGLKLIGHLHMEEYLPYHVRTQGELLKGLSVLDWSGVDRIDLNWEKLSEKYASSAQVIYDQPRTLSETFCFSGWDNHLARMKYWIDWQITKGIDTICLHALYSSIEGKRQWECPPSLFFQNDYWQYFRQLSDYSRRTTFLINQGRPYLDLGIYYPIHTQYDLLWPEEQKFADTHDKEFIELGTSLTNNGYDYLIVNDDGLEKAEIAGRKISVGGAKMRAMILFGLTCMPAAAAKRMMEFAQSGGKLIFIDCEKLRTLEGTGEAEALLKAPHACRVNAYHHNKRYTATFDVGTIIPHLNAVGVYPLVKAPEGKRVECCSRYYDDARLIFALNSENTPIKIRIPLQKEENAYFLNAHTGVIEAIERQLPTDTWTEITLLEMQAVPVLITCEDLPAVKRTSTPSIVRRTSLNLGWEITIDGETLSSPLRSWADLGKPFFSGRAEYTLNLSWKKQNNGPVELDLGQVWNTADIYVNDQFAGTRIWAPWTVDITHLLRDGENKIRISVANTLGNRFEKKPFPSGLLGDVALCEYDE